MENKRQDVTSEGFRKRIAYSARKLGCQTNQIDDLTQEVVTRMLEGKHKHATIDQCVIDYLRRTSGRKGTHGYLIRESKQEPLRENLISRYAGLSVDDRIDFNIITGKLRGWKRCIMLMRFRDGMLEEEIGNYFGFTNGWAHIWIERIQESIRRKIKDEEQRTNKKELEKILPEETEGNWWGLGTGANSGVEKIESWTMECYNEKSF
jgi:DNA-directed RNA polymerase specialized sigma24 family protein